MLFIAAQLLVFSAVADNTVVLGLQAGEGVEKRLEIVRRTQPFGATHEGRELWARIAGLMRPNELSAAELAARLEHADDLESTGEVDAAQRERQSVLDAYECTPVMTSAMQTLAARAVQDRAAALFLANQKKEAAAEFFSAHRRFPTVPIDLMRHRPDIVRAYERAAGDLRNGVRSKLTIHSTRPATVMLDARVIGDVRQSLTVDVLRGRSMLWLRDAAGNSLARPIDIGAEPIAVDVDFELELRLEGKSTPRLRCTDDCEDFTARLRSAAKLDRVIAVRMTGADTSEAVIAEATGVRVMALTEIDAIADPPYEHPVLVHHVSPWSFAPFGIAQFQQGRPLVGGAFAAAFVAAAAWNIVASLGRNPGHQDDSRTGQLVSAALIAGVGLASSADGIVHDYRDQDYP